MATQVQLRRGTATENNSFTGAQGELTFDTTNKRVRVHDGAAAGGFELVTEDASGNINTGSVIATALSVDGGTIKLDGNYPVSTNNVALGNTALDSLTDGVQNTAVGSIALTDNTGGDYNTGVGYASLNANSTGDYNTALGYYSAVSNTTGIQNVAVGADSLRGNTTGNYNVALGRDAMRSNTTASYNTVVGRTAAYTNTTGEKNVAFGGLALQYNTTGSYNVALGMESLNRNTTASNNTAVGYQAGYTLNGGAELTAVGRQAAYSLTSGSENTALGSIALYSTTTGNFNVAVGRQALQNNTTANNNTAVGYQAGYSTTTGSNNTSLGRSAGYTMSGATYTTTIGFEAGLYAYADYNTFIGASAGNTVTSGAKNTILGRYNGNQDGLDIRTGSNNIVLSDGDGNIGLRIDGSTHFAYFGDAADTASGVATLNVAPNPSNNFFAQFWNTSGSAVGSISVTGGGTQTAYTTSSDYRLKENVNYTWDATTRLKQLKPARFNFITDADTIVDGFLAHEAQAVVPESVVGTHNEVDDDGNAVMQGIDQAKLVPLLVKTIQELEARITALENA